MSGNSFGSIFRVTTFGESHGPAVGAVVDGCPAGLELSAAAINRELARRRPGGGGASTTRSEADEGEVLSGVFEGVTLGTPIAIIIRNTAQRSGDYAPLKDIFRPGHADWTWEAKYGLRDHTGGGRSSARETAGRVAGGAVAKILLARYGITIRAWTAAVGDIAAPLPDSAGFDLDEAERNALRTPSAQTALEMTALAERLRAEGDSAGGIVACRVTGIPAGLGEPVFDKLDALLAQAVLSLGAAKGIEFGSGFGAALLPGSRQNDTPLYPPPKTAAEARTECFAGNNAGGIAGGISNGMPLEFRVAFKAVPSISKEQRTVDKHGSAQTISIKGRHDVCVCPRAVPVVEAMTALVLADLMLRQRASRVKDTGAFF